MIVIRSWNRGTFAGPSFPESLSGVHAAKISADRVTPTRARRPSRPRLSQHLVPCRASAAASTLSTWRTPLCRARKDVPATQRCNRRQQQRGDSLSGAHIARARLGLVTKRRPEVPHECTQGDSRWLWRAVERQRMTTRVWLLCARCAPDVRSRPSDQHSS